jgi:ABC-type branched-subunit amino acid transport system substrate-binding protein
MKVTRNFAMVKRWVCMVLCAALSIATGVGAAHAHEFKVGFLSPLSGPETLRGRDALNGFLLATRERDGHPFEESDGHLGGLDSYVIIIDTGRSVENVSRQLDDLLADEDIVFLVVVSVPETFAAASVRLGEAQTILVEPADTAVYIAAISTPGSLVTMDGTSYSTAFRDAHGHEPGTYAIRGYVAARLIDAAVSAVEGQVAQRDALRRALEQASQVLP